MGMEQNNHDAEEGTLEIGMGRFSIACLCYHFSNFFQFYCDQMDISLRIEHLETFVLRK